MVDDVRRLLRSGGYQVPDDPQCARLQAYWDELTAQAGEVGTEDEAPEIAVWFSAWRPEDG